MVIELQNIWILINIRIIKIAKKCTAVNSMIIDNICYIKTKYTSAIAWGSVLFKTKIKRISIILQHN